MNETIYLQLEDGSCFTGKSFGTYPRKDLVSEVVFTTAMTGYAETLTDPSYYGQMVVHSFPLIGNYGVNPMDFESEKIHMLAYLVREYCTTPSNFRSRMELHTLLKRYRIPGMYGIDTRALIRKIREKGVMKGLLTTALPAADTVNTLPVFNCTDGVSQVSCHTPYTIDNGTWQYHVVLWDFGAKKNILRRLHALGCKITVVPSFYTAQEILSLKPDGVMLSNGPGNPAHNSNIIRQLSILCGTGIPLFGICLGHQLMALANGAHTYKLKYGHRGFNQPVKDMRTGHIYITSQNHGYGVMNHSLPSNSELTFINLNDDTCEGIRYRNFPGLSVQFHPEACGGPKDTDFLFHEFAKMMERRILSCH